MYHIHTCKENIMLEIIVFIIIVLAVIQSSKKKNQQRRTPPFTARTDMPERPASSETPRPQKTAQKTSWRKQQKKTASKQNIYSSSPAAAQAEQPLETRTFIEPTKPYRPARNAGERYEEWMPVPEGKTVCHCGYCGADNLIPKHSDPKNYTCYFCREEL